MSTTLRVAELESLFTANTKPFEQAAVKVETRKKDLGRKPAEVQVDADTKGALAGMDRVEAGAKKITSRDVIARIGADITMAEKGADKIRLDLKVLEAMDPSPKVDADITRAKTNLANLEAKIDRLKATRTKLEIQADTSKAESDLDDFQDTAESSGGSGGKAFMGGFLGGLLSTPIAGALVGLGQDAVEAFMEGFDVEARADRFVASTGLDEATAGRIGRAAGEAYADNWGTSIADNMDTARVAMQQGLLDPAATQRDAEAVIASLSGISDIMGQDIPRISQAAATIIRAGLARDAKGAFDVIVRGFQVGNDKAEDWLDTLIEYPVVLTKLGLTGQEMTGLIAQGLAAGARNSDVAADALKEFQIRATDASQTSRDAYRMIGLDAEAMTAKIAAGGAGAREGLDQVLDALRDMEDPVARNAAAVGLFGTKAEDLGDALFAMDLDTAAAGLGEFAGAAETALAALTDNAANDISSAQRNIEVATQGIQGALAAAFNPQIEDFATWVSSNREQIMQFLLDIANGGLDFARSFVEGTASATEGIGDFLGGPMASLLLAIGDLVYGIDAATPGDQHGTAFREWAQGAADQLRDVEDGTELLAESMRVNIIENGIDPLQDRLNGIAIPMIAEARLHDTTVRLAADIEDVGYAADGSALSLADLDLANLTATGSGRALDEQLRAAAEGMRQQITDGAEAGKTQAELAEQYDISRQALEDQLVAMGLTEEQAAALVEQYGLMPSEVRTEIKAETQTAEAKIDAFTNKERRAKVTVDVVGGSEVKLKQVGGGGAAMRFEADGDLLSATPLSGAAVVPPGTLRVVGDRLDVPEVFAPLDGSPRSWAILMEGLRRMPGVMPMADGAVLGGQVLRGVDDRGRPIEIHVHGMSDQWGAALAVADILERAGI